MTLSTGADPGERRSWWLLWSALLLLLLWPAVINGGAFLFPDMPTYVRGFDAAVYKLTGQTGPWTGELFENYPLAAKEGLASSAGQALQPPDKVVLAGRSIYYGALLYLSDLAGSFWFMILAQAALVATAMMLVVDRLGEADVSSKWRWSLLLVPLATPVGYHVGMMMPDILAPLAILAATMSYLFWPRMKRFEQFFWGGVLLLAMLSHSANLAIIGCMFVAMVLVSLILRRRGSYVPILIALVLGATGEVTFSGAVSAATGQAPVRPPFLTARLTADGPGTDYLNEHCPIKADFILCEYRSELPLHSDAFLWSFDNRGVFSELPPAKQRQVAAEQSRFVLAVLLDRPLDVIRSSTLRWVEQLQLTGLEEFRSRMVEPERLAPHVARDFVATKAAQGRMPTNVVEVLTFWITLAALVGGLWLLVTQRRGSNSFEKLAFLSLVLIGVLVNAAVCGVLSTPHDRYQSRVIWLIPFAALVLAAIVRRERSIAPGELAAPPRIHR